MISDKKVQEYRARIKPRKSADYYKIELGKNLETARLSKKLKRADVADIFDWPDERKVRRIEKGESTCSIIDLLNFCDIYELHLDELLPADIIPYMGEIYQLDDTFWCTLMRTREASNRK